MRLEDKVALMRVWWISVECPRCKARPGHNCCGLPTLTGRPHNSRVLAAIHERF